MPDIKLTKNSLRKLRKSLPHGAITRIAQEANCSRTNVNNVLKGYYFNEKVIIAAIKEAKQHLKTQSALSRIIDQLNEE